MKTKFSYIGLAAAAALIGQQALAQSATVDASANVVAAGEPIGLSTLSNVSFGTVTIPSDASETCSYHLWTAADDPSLTWSYSNDFRRPQIHYGEGVAEIRGALTQDNSGGILAPEHHESCVFVDPPSFGEIDVECPSDAPFSISVSVAEDAGAQYAGLQFWVPGPAAIASVSSCDGSKNLTIGAGLFVPGTATAYTGSVGTYTIEAIYD